MVFINCLKDNRFWMWWRTPLIPALRKQRQAISEFEASLVYKVSSRTARAIKRKAFLDLFIYYK